MTQAARFLSEPKELLLNLLEANKSPVDSWPDPQGVHMFTSGSMTCLLRRKTSVLSIPRNSECEKTYKILASHKWKC